MKTFIKNLFLLPLISGLSLIPSSPVTAQIFTNLHSFSGSDGNNPWAGLILSGNTLYGTAKNGGSFGGGTAFAVNTDGADFTNLHNFADSDGTSPRAGLIVSGNTLYGVALNGGGFGWGALFAVNTDGTGFTNLHSFTVPFEGTNSDGVFPTGGLVLSGNTLYGTAQQAGSRNRGTIFKINTDGTDFTILYNFSGDNDGVAPYAGLILSGNILYGTTRTGGSFGGGTVFAASIDGTFFTNVYSFTQGNDGANPVSGVILSGDTLYGTAYGGSSGNGTVFAVNTNGTGFTLLHTFTALFGGSLTNSDGAAPNAGLILSGNTLYGTLLGGGSAGYGTLYALNTDGTDFTTLYNFTSGSDGANPAGGLILSGNTLYGTTLNGGSSGNGAVFSFSLPLPQLALTLSGTNVILSWPLNAAGFTLQSTTNLVSSAAWTTVSPLPSIVNGQNTVTNSISGLQNFYRLIE
jgi:uncharacterized repeat protein (TIGR03803 family)